MEAEKTIVYNTIYFFWESKGVSNRLQVHDRTLNDALIEALEFGYTPYKWYRPSTWNNHYIAI